MAQTKRKRKHRGTAAGTIEKAAHNRKTKQASRPSTRQSAREARMYREPTWRGAANKAGLAALVFGVLLALAFHRPVGVAALWVVIVFFFYLPIGYWTDRAVYNRRMRARAKRGGG
jgi:hypothetical protein